MLKSFFTFLVTSKRQYRSVIAFCCFRFKTILGLSAMPEATLKLNRPKLIAPGLSHTNATYITRKQSFTVNIIQFHPEMSELVLEIAMAGDSVSRQACMAEFACAPEAFAAINGGFFHPRLGILQGLTIVENEVISGPFRNRSGVGWTHDGKVAFGVPSWQCQIKIASGQPFKVDGLNQLKSDSLKTVIYNYRWGDSVCLQRDDNGLLIQDDVIVEKYTETCTKPLPGQWILVAPRGVCKQFNIGETVSCNVSLGENWSTISSFLSGGPCLLKNGHPVISLWSETFQPVAFTIRAARTAIGQSADGHLLLVTTEGQEREGLTLSELAHVFQLLNTTDAVNLDGGSSSQMRVQGTWVGMPASQSPDAINTALVIGRFTNASSQPHDKLYIATSKELAK